ncbi:hypothetical protein CGLO_14226 [Colletotrichum gloeosporioides Cg-14]|uniref:Nephrocystin 3-like N-terminal domain-containing protein n=1 Tax=Colletotrichum gloeosporioides (strain Cg-14) TaxID=1237896 RepID=T0L563_COLGC|nr:hypothetical protein CGLO_14226 [Colletotrichum gloeosporioides Cg-14]
MEDLRAAIAAAKHEGRKVMATFRCREREFLRLRLSELEESSKICDQIQINPVLRLDRDTETSLKRCADNVTDIKVLLEEVVSFKKDSVFRRSWKSLVGDNIDDEFVRLFNRLQRERAALKLQMATATSDAEYQMGVATTEAQPRAANPGRPTAKGWLSGMFITDPWDDRSTLISAKGKRAEGTCTWILETDAFNTWMNTTCQGLWITGGPGIGKSMMSIFLTEQLELKAASSETESVIYFFCDSQSDRRDNARAILQALIWQLGTLKPELRKHGKSQMQFHPDGEWCSTRMESLCRAFNSMVEHPDAGRVFCVIDGLDECDNTSGGLVNCFLGVSTSRFKTIILSRPLNQSLTNSLSKYVRLRLASDSEKEVKADLNAFIQQRVQRLSDDCGFPPGLRQILHDTFIQGSEGSFVWVGLAAQELETEF